MERPIISPQFTIEDIHKIREYNYEITKNMSMEEQLQYYNASRTGAKEAIDALRAKRLASQGQTAV